MRGPENTITILPFQAGMPGMRNGNSLTPNPNIVDGGDHLPSVGPQPHSVATLKTSFAPKGEGSNVGKMKKNEDCVSGLERSLKKKKQNKYRFCFHSPAPWEGREGKCKKYN